MDDWVMDEKCGLALLKPENWGAAELRIVNSK
jgi:hypothetical protein